MLYEATVTGDVRQTVDSSAGKQFYTDFTSKLELIDLTVYELITTCQIHSLEAATK